MAFVEGKAQLVLSQNDVAKAIEFWLNSEILKFPCKVTGLAESRVNSRSTFDVEFQAVKEGNDVAD